MKSKLHALVLVCAFFGLRAEAATKTLVELDRGEPFEAMTFHANHLWVGQSRKNFNSNYRVQVYDRKDNAVQEVTLKHAVTFLYPYGPSSVLAIGTAHTPNLTHFSILTIKGNQIQAKTTAIPANAWGHQWLGTLGDKELFIDLSGNSNDPEAEKNFNLPAQTLFTMSRANQAKYLPIRVRAPIQGTRIGDTFYLLQLYSLGNPRTNVMRVEPRTGTAKQLFAEPLNRALDILPVDGANLAVSESGADRVLVVEGTTGIVKATLESKSGPRSLARLGRCLIVGNEASRDVTVTDISNLAAPKTVLTIDFKGTGDLFRGLRKLTVDASTGRLYGRSAYACNPMAEDCSRLWNSVAVSDAADAEKLKAACK